MKTTFGASAQYAAMSLLICSLVWSCGGSGGAGETGTNSTDTTQPSDPIAFSAAYSKPVTTYSPPTRGSGYGSTLSPGDLKVHYNMPTQFTGAGQSIAIVVAPGTSNPANDLNAFSRYYNLPQCTPNNPCFTMIDLSNGAKVLPSNDWTVEIALDTQWAHAIAPGAQIILIQAKTTSMADLMAAVRLAVTQKNVVAVSMSWGAYEFSNETSAAYDGFFAQYPNIAFIAPSGDSGNNGHNQIYPAASPYVTAVGGTSIHSLSLPITNTTETAWSLGGGGPSIYETIPSYQNNYLIASNDLTVLGANGHRRGIPDVAYNADPNVSPLAVNIKGLWYGVGGTSEGVPQWAGIIANFAQYLQTKGTSLPKILAAAHGLNSVLYQTKLEQANSLSFFDVTSGSDNTGNGICILCSASNGYDDVSGLGIPNVGTLFGHF